MTKTSVGKRDTPLRAARPTRGAKTRSRLLLTGFGPFPGAPDNPTGPLIRALAQRLRKDGVAVSTHVFRTTYAGVDRGLPRLIQRVKPDAMLMFGLAGKARGLRVETCARNRIARFPDASFAIPASRMIEPSGVTLRPIRAPKAALLRAAKSAGLPARLSANAGDYLCNYLYWHALAALPKHGGPSKAAFIHVPLPSKRFTLDRMTQSAEAIARAIIRSSRPRKRY